MRELSATEERAAAALDALAEHRKEVLGEVPPSFRDVAALILAHHECHYAAERKWLHEALAVFSARKGNKEGEA